LDAETIVLDESLAATAGGQVIDDYPYIGEGRAAFSSA